MHLLLGDLAVFGLISGQELIKRGQPPVMVGFEAQRFIHPGTHAVGLPAGDRLLGRRDQFSVDGCRQSLLSTHTFMLHLCHIYGSRL